MGKTSSRAARPASVRKHPHERGEDFLKEKGFCDPVRNTPTSVGKTGLSVSSTKQIGKHPHERGEDSVILLDFITQKIGSILVANELQAIQ